jgi:hypothetical protein
VNSSVISAPSAAKPYRFIDIICSERIYLVSHVALSDPPAVRPPSPRRRWGWWIVAALVVVVSVGTLVFSIRGWTDPAIRGGPMDRPTSQTQIGVFRGTDPQEVQKFNDWLGRDVDYVVDFSTRDTWQEIAEPQYMIDAWKGTPYRMVYSLAMLPLDPADTMERGASGEYDHYFVDLAQRLVAGGQQDAVLRLGWEFNLDSWRWSTSDSAAFIAYWRHIVTAMRSVPGQKFQFDWNVNNGTTPNDAVNYYPGNDVVDYVGVDAYDDAWGFHTYPYPADCDDSCRADRQKNAWNRSIYGGPRGLKFWSKFAAHHGKPMSLPEWGMWQRQDGHGGGQDADYLRRMQAFIADPANDVAYQAYFEVDGPDGPHRLMTDYPQAGAVFKTLFGKPVNS